MAKISTKLNVSLYDNPLTERKDDFVGRVQLNGVLTNETVAKFIVAERTEFRYETILNILTLGDEVKCQHLAAGYAVNDGVAHMQPNITGSFIGAAAQFNPTVHSVGVAMSPSTALRNTIKETTVVVQGLAMSGTVINKVQDMFSGEENGIITPNRNLKIFGQRLKIVGENAADVGIWFIKSDDETVRIKVDERDIIDNNPSQLTVVTPTLSAGEYYVEIATQYSKSTIPLKEPRIFRFELPLAVQ